MSSSSFAENLPLGVCDGLKLKFDICRSRTWWPLCPVTLYLCLQGIQLKNTDLTPTFHVWIDTRVFFCVHADKIIHFSFEFLQPRMYVIVIGRPLLKHRHLWKSQMSCAYSTHLLNLLSWIVNVIPNIFLVLIFCYTIFCELRISKETNFLSTKHFVSTIPNIFPVGSHILPNN